MPNDRFRLRNTGDWNQELRKYVVKLFQKNFRGVRPQYEISQLGHVGRLDSGWNRF